MLNTVSIIFLVYSGHRSSRVPPPSARHHQDMAGNSPKGAYTLLLSDAVGFVFALLPRAKAVGWLEEDPCIGYSALDPGRDRNSLVCILCDYYWDRLEGGPCIGHRALEPSY